MSDQNNSLIKEQTYYVNGMHCASCEILIEKQLINLPNIKSVDASLKNGKVVISYEGNKPQVDELSAIFKKSGYTFSEEPKNISQVKQKNNFFIIFILAILFILGFIGLNKLGLAGLINVTSTSSLLLFFVLGLLAGISSCAALVGGIILSMSKQWLDLYGNNSSFSEKFKPHWLFNLGRLISYGFFGAILGLIGSKLQLSLSFSSILILFISIIMIVLGLQMLGVKSLQRLQFTAPRFITRKLANEKNFQGKFMPFIMGAATFFLPCGFTITAQGLALLSDNFLQGSLIMFVFALGTMPALLLIGLTSIKLSQNHNWSEKFMKLAGIIVIFFALFNINSQLNILGISSFSNLSAKTSQNNLQSDLPPIINGKQLIQMEANSSGYNPNYFKIRVGIPVHWEIIDTGTSGCTNAVISKNLFSDAIQLTPGQTSVKEFTPTSAGKYKFSCWMGMVSGIIEVI